MSDPAEQEEGLSPRCFPTRSCCAYAWQAVPCTSCGKIECGHRPCPVCRAKVEES